MKLKRAGFTLVELMVLVGILSIVVAIAVPYYLPYSRRSKQSACITNMKKIEGAVMLAKMSGIPDPEKNDIVGALSHLKAMPTCPNNKAPYTVFDPPECPACDASHVLPTSGQNNQL